MAALWIGVAVVLVAIAVIVIQSGYWYWKVVQIERKSPYPIEVWQEFAASLIEPDRTTMFALIHKGRYPLGALIRCAHWFQDRQRQLANVRRVKGAPIVPAKPGVYVLESQQRYKIGKSTNVRARVYTIQTTSPYPVSIVCVFWTHNVDHVERTLHERFARKRLAREWFSLTSNDVKLLKEAAKNPAAIGAEELEQ